MSGSPPWPAPARPRPGRRGAERETLQQFLDDHRATFLLKCSGLDAAQLARRALPPSSLSLQGLLRHLAEAEQYWFCEVLDGRQVQAPYWTPQSPDRCFEVDGEDVARDRATYDAQVAASREVLARHALDAVGHRDGTAHDVRWILTHLVGEYARHNGHADLLRQAIDGSVGQ